MQYEYNKRQQVKVGQCLWPPLIVARQATKAGRPGKAAFHHPATRQEDKAAFGFGQADCLQADALAASRLSRGIAG